MYTQRYLFPFPNPHTHPNHAHWLTPILVMKNLAMVHRPQYRPIRYYDAIFHLEVHFIFIP